MFARYLTIILTFGFSDLHQAPLNVEGWEEALHEIGKLSYETVLTPKNEELLLKAVEKLPVLVIAGADDVIVPLKSVQSMASKLVNSVSPMLSLSFISSSSWFISICNLNFLIYLVKVLKDKLSCRDWSQ